MTQICGRNAYVTVEFPDGTMIAGPMTARVDVGRHARCCTGNERHRGGIGWNR